MRPNHSGSRRYGNDSRLGSRQSRRPRARVRRSRPTPETPARGPSQVSSLKSPPTTLPKSARELVENAALLDFSSTPRAMAELDVLILEEGLTIWLWTRTRRLDRSCWSSAISGQEDTLPQRPSSFTLPLSEKPRCPFFHRTNQVTSLSHSFRSSVNWTHARLQLLGLKERDQPTAHPLRC